MTQQTISIDDLRSLPPTVGVEAAARVLGCGRTLAYELIQRSDFPCRVLPLGIRYVIPTAELLKAIGLSARRCRWPLTSVGHHAPAGARVPFP
jgi:hypothetical protein